MTALGGRRPVSDLQAPTGLCAVGRGEPGFGVGARWWVDVTEAADDQQEGHHGA